MKTVHFIRITIVIFLVVGITITIAYRRHFNVAALEQRDSHEVKDISAKQAVEKI